MRSKSWFDQSTIHTEDTRQGKASLQGSNPAGPAGPEVFLATFFAVYSLLRTYFHSAPEPDLQFLGMSLAAPSEVCNEVGLTGHARTELLVFPLHSAQRRLQARNNPQLHSQPTSQASKRANNNAIER